jgi:hypothetical protein
VKSNDPNWALIETNINWIKSYPKKI